MSLTWTREEVVVDSIKKAIMIFIRWYNSCLLSCVQILLRFILERLSECIAACLQLMSIMRSDKIVRKEQTDSVDETASDLSSILVNAEQEAVVIISTPMPVRGETRLTNNP